MHNDIILLTECICMYVWVKEHWVAEFFTHRYYLYTYYTVSFCFSLSSPLFSMINAPFRSFFAPTIPPHVSSLLKMASPPSFLLCESTLPTYPSYTYPSPNHYPSSNRTNVKSGVSALSSTSTAFGTAASNNRLDHAGNGHIDEALRQQALAEEEAAMNQYKVPKGCRFEEGPLGEKYDEPYLYFTEQYTSQMKVRNLSYFSPGGSHFYFSKIHENLNFQHKFCLFVCYKCLWLLLHDSSALLYFRRKCNHRRAGQVRIHSSVRRRTMPISR